MKYFVFQSLEEAVAANTLIFARGAALAEAEGYHRDPASNALTGRANGKNRPDAIPTSGWYAPRRRLDGAWVVLHPSHHPLADTVIAGTGETYAGFVSTEITAPVESVTEDGFAAEQNSPAAPPSIVRT